MVHGVPARRPPSFRRRREGGRDARLCASRDDREEDAGERTLLRVVWKTNWKTSKKEEEGKDFFIRKEEEELVETCAPTHRLTPSRRTRRACGEGNTTTTYSTTILPQNIRILSECEYYEIISSWTRESSASSGAELPEAGRRRRTVPRRSRRARRKRERNTSCPELGELSFLLLALRVETGARIDENNRCRRLRC